MIRRPLCGLIILCLSTWPPVQPASSFPILSSLHWSHLPRRVREGGMAQRRVLSRRALAHSKRWLLRCFSGQWAEKRGEAGRRRGQYGKSLNPTGPLLFKSLGQFWNSWTECDTFFSLCLCSPLAKRGESHGCNVFFFLVAHLCRAHTHAPCRHNAVW